MSKGWGKDAKRIVISDSCMERFITASGGSSGVDNGMRVNTRALPTGQLEQILSLSAIPSISVSPTLLDEAKAALYERQTLDVMQSGGDIDDMEGTDCNARP